MRDRTDPADQDAALTGRPSEAPIGAETNEATGPMPPGTMIEAYPIDPLTGRRLTLEEAGLEHDGALTGRPSEAPIGSETNEATGPMPPGTMIEAYPIDSLTGRRLTLEEAGLDQDEVLTGRSPEAPIGSKPSGARGPMPPGRITGAYPVNPLTGARLDFDDAALDFATGAHVKDGRGALHPPVQPDAGAERGEGAAADDVADRPSSGEAGGD